MAEWSDLDGHFTTLMALDYNRIFIKHIRGYHLKNSLDMVLTMGCRLINVLKQIKKKIEIAKQIKQKNICMFWRKSN